MSTFLNALTQLRTAAKVGKVRQDLLKVLENPEREVRGMLNFRNDKGELVQVEGYRVEHSSLLGPYKGGIRFHELTDLDEVKALSLWMTIKCAVANLPLGGGKGGATVDPKKLSKKELENLSRAWVKTFFPILGPTKDIPAPDVNTTPEIMDWMTNEYQKISKQKIWGTFTGKSVKKGGSLGRGVATALGGVYVLEELTTLLKLPMQLNVVIQGSGNAGLTAAKILSGRGHKIMAISDSKTSIVVDAGINIEQLEKFKKENSTIKNFPGSKEISKEEFFKLECDVLVPAALENQITKDNALGINAKVVLELANGPTTSEADVILKKRNVAVIPDVLANSGGVIVSCFEWMQNNKNQKWSEEKVFKMLKEKITGEAKNVWKTAKEKRVDMRTGAFVLALRRLDKKFK